MKKLLLFVLGVIVGAFVMDWISYYPIRGR